MLFHRNAVIKDLQFLFANQNMDMCLGDTIPIHGIQMGNGKKMRTNYHFCFPIQERKSTR